MLTVENLTFSFPKKELYKDVTFTLEPGHHCAFIGTSGSGKSTLIEMIMDNDKYHYKGEIDVHNNCLVGFVSQFCQVDKSRELTAFEYIADEFNTLQNDIANICVEMETSEDIEPLLEEYQNKLDALQAIGGDDFESMVHKKLNIAELFKLKDLKITELSGGEFKLIQVIKEMLNHPELLIMDEPDVFLDFQNLDALRKLINTHKGMLLIVTHNRYLLNHCFNKIIHIENMELQEFEGTYMAYNYFLLQMKIELQELSIEDDEEIARNAILIDRLRVIATYSSEAAKGKSLKARVKIQERLEARRIKPPFVAIKKPNIHLLLQNPVEEMDAIILEDYSVAFDEVLLKNVNLEIKSTDKVALIGKNGTGKTTLMRAIFNNNSPSIKVADGIELAYLSQQQGESLTEDNTIVEEFFDADFESYSQIKSYLFNYDFDEEFIESKISTLSGGEKNILQLAKVSASQANMLLLDEPTSHLDTYSQLALEETITDYKGGIIMISHDYYTIANSMDYVLIIEDKNIRKMTMKRFRKMIYKHHFDKDYLSLELEKKTLELKVEAALNLKNFKLAKTISEELEAVIKLFQK